VLFAIGAVLRSRAMRDLMRTSRYAVTVDEGARVVRRVRSAEPFASLGQLEADYAELVRVMDLVDRARYALLVDVRAAPPRNDPQFEAAVERHHEALYRGFRASAILVQSAVGRLQLKRMFDESGVKVRVFADEGEALRYLADAIGDGRTP
jgi:hypothetical protein